MATRTHVALALVLACSLFPSLTRSHAEYRPFSANRYLELGADAEGLQLSWSLTVGDMPASRLRQRFDADADGELNAAEIKALRDHLTGIFARGLLLELDGERVLPRVHEEEFDLSSSLVAMFAPMRLRIRAQIPCPTGIHSLRLADHGRLEAAGQSELRIEGLRLRSSQLEPGEPQPALRQTDPQGFIQQLVWEDGHRGAPLRLTFALETQAPVGQAFEKASPLEDEAGALKTALSDKHLSPAGWLIALLIAFGLGALHALSPGHGKTLVAAYLVGSRGKIRHAVLLGGIVTLTHVASVFLLGAVALGASEFILPERLAPWLSLTAGLLVLGMGLWMLRSRWKESKDSHHHDHDHDQHHHHHGHDHHDHNHPNNDGPRLGELLTLGISGGLVPCPSATVVMLLAIYLGRILFGMGLLLAFSAGLAFTLVLIGILVVQGRKWLEGLSQGARTQTLVRLLPLASALLVSGLGLWLTLEAITLTIK